MLSQQAHHGGQHGTRAAGSGWRLAAFAASVAYLTLNVNDYVRHMEQMPYSGKTVAVLPSAVKERVNKSGEHAFNLVSCCKCTQSLGRRRWLGQFESRGAGLSCLEHYLHVMFTLPG